MFRRLLKWIAASWALFIALVAAIELVHALMCSPATVTWYQCHTFVSVVRNTINASLYIITGSIFLLTLAMLVRIKCKDTSNASNQINMGKVYAGIATFSLFYLPMVLLGVWILWHYVTKTGYNMPCFLLGSLVPIEWAIQAVTAGMYARIAVDAVIGFFIDKRLRIH